MENRINIAELLKDCPTGMELDCKVFDAKVIYQGLNKRIPTHPIVVQTEHGFEFELTQYGQIHNIVGSKCVIFPTGKTTWEGFQIPFKDGIIKYHWDTETKTFEKLVEPKFKIEKDKWYVCIKDLDDNYGTRAFHQGSTYYSTKNETLLPDNSNTPFEIKYCVNDYFRLWTIQDAKDGDVLTTDLVHFIFKSQDDRDCYMHCNYAVVSNNFSTSDTAIVDSMYVHPATKEQRDILFQKMKEAGYKWNAETKTLEKLVEPIFKVGNRIRHKEETTWTCVIKRIDDKYWVYGHPTCYTIPLGEQDEYELVPNKFDINTLKPFESKVLVRHNKDNKWCGSFFSFIDRDFQSYCYKFVTTAGKSYPMMIPYKGNEYLLGKTDDCNEYYKIWE